MIPEHCIPDQAQKSTLSWRGCNSRRLNNTFTIVNKPGSCTTSQSMSSLPSTAINGQSSAPFKCSKIISKSRARTTSLAIRLHSRTLPSWLPPRWFPNWSQDWYDPSVEFPHYAKWNSALVNRPSFKKIAADRAALGQPLGVVDQKHIHDYIWRNDPIHKWWYQSTKDLARVRMLAKQWWEDKLSRAFTIHILSISIARDYLCLRRQNGDRLTDRPAR